MTTSIAVGNRRLLKLADILDVADAQHRKNKEPTYAQWAFQHACGTPACALGHWAAANPRRWRFNGLNVPELKNKKRSNSALSDACTDFALNYNTSYILFSLTGCGGARTAKQAARYIRRFVAQRQKETK